MMGGKRLECQNSFCNNNCMCIVATLLHLLNVLCTCNITEQILLPVFLDFISPSGSIIISFDTFLKGFLKKGAGSF